MKQAYLNLSLPLNIATKSGQMAWIAIWKLWNINSRLSGGKDRNLKYHKTDSKCTFFVTIVLLECPRLNSKYQNPGHGQWSSRNNPLISAQGTGKGQPNVQRVQKYLILFLFLFSIPPQPIKQSPSNRGMFTNGSP